MLVIPAIDIKDGKTVRLKQGNFAEKTVYSETPVASALYFQNLGAKRLHLVDLDGAESGEAPNRIIVEEILGSVKIPIQLGGGIRSLEAIARWLDLGIQSIIIGTIALANPEIVKGALQKFGAERVIVAVDALDGMVATEGWQKQSKIKATDLALNYKRAGLEKILYTDIERDGMLTGPNLMSIKDMAVATNLKIIASGGVSSKEDLKDLEHLEQYGVDSVVVGRAFYERRLLPEEIL